MSDSQGLGLGDNHRGATICAVCLAIPFDRLPAEEEAAYPHHATLQDLRASASRCPLCALLVQSIDEEQARLENEEEKTGVFLGDLAFGLQGQGYGNPVVGYVQSIRQFQDVRVESDRRTLLARDLGRNQPATFENVRLAQYGVETGRPAKVVLTGRGLDPSGRPHIYGNWWLLDQPDERDGPATEKDYYRLQLMGIGVRLTETPSPHAYPDDPSAQYIPGRTRELFSGSIKSRDLLRFWVHACDAGHKCHPTEPPALPTRVLDLGSPPTFESVKLVETKGGKGQYVALSHSWGGVDILTTKRQTLQAHAAGIPIGKLPQTFLDTVQIATGLGIRYVWIDSLCIVQDDFEDWEREAPRMAEVYSNAYLTVSSSHALNPTEGCFPRWRMFEYTPSDNLSTGTREKWNHLDFVPLPTSVSFRRPSKLFLHKGWLPPSAIEAPTVYRNGNFGSKRDPIASETLSSRAWTLQERLLSPRVLHFGRDQMFWQCQSCFIAEDGSRFDPAIFSLDAVIETQRVNPADKSAAVFMSFVPEASIPSQEEGRFKGGWLHVVADFSRRRLTYGDDKLAALSGLANIIASRTGDTYICGLWERHIYQDLCWKVDRSHEVEIEMKLWDMRLEPDRDINTPYDQDIGLALRDDSKALEIKRVPGRAPSWSWASMDAPLSFQQIQGDRIVAKLINHEVKPSGKDKYGRVSSGFVVLHAPLLPLEARDLKASSDWIRDTFDKKHPLETPVQVSVGGETAAGFAAFDLERSFPCFALFLDSAYALVLEATSTQKQEFRRIGLAKFIPTQSQANESVTSSSAVADVVYSSHEKAQGPVRQDHTRTLVRIV
ncbi:hypothetical protein jhhlp_008125 [Lomentospora prolificans]|uniref:Heterokaryon incompatibility domain-containing protein n=1 Tax=Lomentospora prolificans TaxID=41688 RepID=A0A2N3MZK0_9PEZI|nr:hypothetical protein jhhlp_008125 [Lomentospora prolificans]